MEVKKQNTKWHSVYLFYNQEINYFLVKFMKPLVDRLVEDRLIISYFFIRYSDGGPHVRLRVLSTIGLEDILIENLRLYLAEEHYLIKYAFVDYIPEILRYGSQNAIVIAENQFYNSSKVSLKFLSENIEHWDYTLAIGYAIEMHVEFAKGIGLSRIQAINFFAFLSDRWFSTAAKIIKVSNEELKNAFQISFEQQKIKLTQNISRNWNKINRGFWYTSNKSIAEKLELYVKAGKLSLSEEFYTNKNIDFKWNIFDSYCHMTNNRLGVSNVDEAYIYFVIFKGLEFVDGKFD